MTVCYLSNKTLKFNLKRKEGIFIHLKKPLSEAQNIFLVRMFLEPGKLLTM